MAMTWRCHCTLGLTQCDLDNPRCADFHRATYREMEEGLWEHEKTMADDLALWASVRAAENEPPLDAGDAAMEGK